MFSVVLGGGAAAFEGNCRGVMLGLDAGRATYAYEAMHTR